MDSQPAPAARRPLDPVLTFLARRVLRVFFRRVEVAGLGRLPQGRPLVVVGNHVNALIDPLVLLGTLPLRPRFLAKSTLWEIRALRPLLALSGAVPVYRRQDPGADTAKNVETFARCHEVLAQGGAIALFPEGISHDQPGLAPLRTGAARIVLEAEERLGPLGVRLQPVGLVFEAKGSFRSRVLVQLGEPIDPAPELALYRRDPVAAVGALTERIEEGLRAVTVSYDSWQEAALIARAADLFERPELDVPRGRGLEAKASLHRALVEGYRELHQRFPERVERVAGAVRAYDRLLRAAGLNDAQVASRYPASPVLRFLGRSAAYLALVLPLALVGSVLNYLPYRLAGWIARRAASSRDVEATFKLFPSLLLYPATWLGEAAAAGWLAGGWAAATTLVAAPAAGWVALRFHDRRRGLFREARAYLLLRARQGLAGELRARRDRAFREVEALAELYREGLGEGARR